MPRETVTRTDHYAISLVAYRRAPKNDHNSDVRCISRPTESSL